MNNDREEYLRVLDEYYSGEYIKSVNLDCINDIETRNYLAKFNLRLWSHRNRIVRNIQILKYSFVADKTNIIAICCKITLDSVSCIYAYIYCECIQINGSLTFNPLFICTGPTFHSQDGEYRYRFIRWEQFEQLYDRYLADFELVESIAVRDINNGRLSFQTDFYYPMLCDLAQRELKEFIDNKRLCIKLYVLCWIVDYFHIRNKIIENHTNPAYSYVMYEPENEPIYQELCQRFNRVEYLSLIQKIIEHKSNIDDPVLNINEIQCGQKIFPLTAIEAVKTNNINFNVWREIYIMNSVSNLVLNLIAPSFPFINNWFYIQNARAGLFDNMAMHDKYMQSDVANTISADLKNVDKYNYIDKTVSSGPITNKFLRLSKSIHKSIVYADSAIKLTDLAICMTSEYVGRTLRDIPNLVMHNEHLFGMDKVFTDIDIFTKHMFEFIYSFYCMNTKIGIIHGDLHMNNVTIYRLYHMGDNDGTVYVDNPHIAYILGQDTYLFKHVGLFSMIIDFSRSIIGDYKRLENDFSPHFAELYFKEQRARVINVVNHHFPALVKKFRDIIEALLLGNFALMFKILTVIDTHIIMSNILAMFSTDSVFNGAIKLAPGVVKLLQKIVEQSEYLMVTNIKNAIEGRITSADEIEWPNLLILRDQFRENILTRTGSPNIVEIFNSNNDVIYNIEDYSTWGPLLSLDKEMELRKKFNQSVEDIQHWMQYKQRDESDRLEQLVSKYEHQVKDTLEFESWMLI
jgi:hypothetical protein